jgi:hypothetical protein
MNVLLSDNYKNFVSAIVTKNLQNKIVPYLTNEANNLYNLSLLIKLNDGDSTVLNELINKIEAETPPPTPPISGTAPVTQSTSGTAPVTPPTSGTDAELTPMEKETSEKVQEDILNEIKTNGADSKFAKELIDGIINGVVNDPSFAEKVAIVMKNTGGAKKTRRKRKQRKTLRKPKPKRNKTKRRK